MLLLAFIRIPIYILIGQFSQLACEFQSAGISERGCIQQQQQQQNTLQFNTWGLMWECELVNENP